MSPEAEAVPAEQPAPPDKPAPLLAAVKKTIPAVVVEGTPYIIIRPGDSCSVEVNGNQYGGGMETTAEENMTERQKAAVVEMHAAFTE